MYAGHKLLAIWKYPQASYDVLEQHLDTHFVPPLSPVRLLSRLRAPPALLCPRRARSLMIALRACT